MPLRPNVIERRLLKRGSIPPFLLDASLTAFTLQAIVAAMELGVFDAFRDGQLTVEALADRTGADPDGLYILVRALVPLGYLSRDGDAYELTTAAERSLPEGDVPAMGTFFREQARQGLDSAQAVREAPAEGVIGWETVQSGEVGHGYQETMRWIASDLVEPVVEMVDVPADADRMLDVGGSHGLYTLGFCEAHPGLDGTIIDWEIGLDAARRTLEEHPGMADRIDLVARDFETEPLPDGNDFVFLGQIVHGLSAEGNRELFEKLGQATTDRGTIAILDQVADPPSTSRLPLNPMDSSFAEGVAALLGFGLFVFTGGRSYAYDDLAAWLGAAGFADVSYQPIREAPGLSLVVARKP